MADATDNGAPAAEAAAAGEQDGEAGAAAPVAGEAGAAVAEGGVDINEDDNEVITVSSDSDEEMEEGRRQGEPDSDYMPSDDEPAVSGRAHKRTHARTHTHTHIEEAPNIAGCRGSWVPQLVCVWHGRSVTSTVRACACVCVPAG